ncbi:MAG: hypothetical protein GXY36_08400, partial [Chloroflexi bacterium]|nr:hypothetical protein [Chloroflexota bacterium]
MTSKSGQPSLRRALAMLAGLFLIVFSANSHGLLQLETGSLALAQGGGRTPTGGQPWDLKERDQPGQFTFYDSPAEASLIGQPLTAGDLDGNGCGDLAVGALNASFARPDAFRSQAGHVRVIMNICDLNGQVDVEALDETDMQVLTFYGARRQDTLGAGVYIDDFNGDGYDDLLMSAPNNDGTQGGRFNAGAVYWLAGGPNFADREDIDLLEPPDDLLVIYGAQETARLGMWVDGGDFDGDGFQDILMGATEADGENAARPNAGEVWIVFGGEDMLGTYGTLLDLLFPPEDATRIIGPDPDDLFGSTVFGADLNGDGYDEVIASAALYRGSGGVEGLSFGGGDGPANRRYNAGDTFIIFGDRGFRGRSIDLARRIDANGAPTNSSVTAIYGLDVNDFLGEEIYVGDLNGDGQPELILGTLVSNGRNNQFEGAGEAWVISTREPFAGQMIDLASPTDRAVVIHVDQAYAKAGDTVEVIDIDQDGYGDLMFGAPTYSVVGYDGVQRSQAGVLAVIYGDDWPDGLPPNVGGELLLFDPPGEARIQYIVAADPNDMMAYHLTA